MTREETIQFYEYIAGAFRYAQENIKERIDANRFIILLPKYSSYERDKILGLPIYFVESLSSDFDIACPHECSEEELKVLSMVREYKNLYPMEANR